MLLFKSEKAEKLLPKKTSELKDLNRNIFSLQEELEKCKIQSKDKKSLSEKEEKELKFKITNLKHDLATYEKRFNLYYSDGDYLSIRNEIHRALKAWVKENIPNIKNFNLLELSPYNAVNITRAMYRLHLLFPNLFANSLDEIVCQNFGDYYYARCEYKTPKSKIIFNTNMYTESIDFISIAKNLDETPSVHTGERFHPKMRKHLTQYDAVSIHELGHAIDHYIKNAWKRKYGNLVVPEYMEGESTFLRYRGYNTYLEESAKKVSKYSTQDSRELFAECFSAGIYGELDKPFLLVDKVINACSKAENNQIDKDFEEF